MLAVIFVLAGINHFVMPGMYQKIIPPGFPSPAVLVAVSGICEIAGGIGVLIPSLRRAAGLGLIALLICVFPANIYMAIHPEIFHISPWLLWARLPLQALLIAWVWSVTRFDKSQDFS